MIPRYCYLICLLLFFNSCSKSRPGFNFDNFEKTDLYDLSIAVKKEDLKLILREYKRLKVNIDSCEKKYGNNLLMLAVSNNLNKSVECLLDLGANPNKESLKIDSGFVKTPISVACTEYYMKKRCDTEIIKLLIKKGANVNKKMFSYNLKHDKRELNFETPLMIASKSNCLEVVKMLIESGAKIDEFDETTGMCAVTNSLIQENLNVLEYLIIVKNAKIPLFCIKGDDGINITFFEIMDNLKLDGFPEKIKSKERIIKYLEENEKK